MINDQQEAFAKKHHHDEVTYDTPELDATVLDKQFRPLVDIVYHVDPRARHSVILCALDRFQRELSIYLHVQSSGGDLLWFRRGTERVDVMRSMLDARKVEGPKLIDPRKPPTPPTPEEIAEARAKTDSYYCVKCLKAVSIDKPESVDNITCEECLNDSSET